MTEPRPWPNNAKEARDRSAEEAQAGIRALGPLVEGRRMTETEQLRRVARAMMAFQSIARHMESQGAPTRPE
jgi:hypothetical protein